MADSKTKQILAADIGGTSSRFAQFIFSEQEGLVLGQSLWLETNRAKSFSDLMQQLASSNFPLAAAKADVVVFAVAGPVEEGVYSKPPNIKWDINLANASADYGIDKVFLINDFIAQAFACLSPIVKDAEQILAGERRKNAAIAVVGAGTGFGKAVLLPGENGKFIAGSSEGGHANFSAENVEEFEFAEFVSKKIGGYFATWDDVVSGRGLTAIHEFLTGKSLDAREVAALFSKDSKTLQLASRFYGRVCRNYALETVCFGGLYLAGGIAAKNPMLVKHAEFEKSFRTSRAHAALLQKIPVFLNKNEDCGLWGAGYYGYQSRF